MREAQEEVNNCQDVSLMWFPPTIYLWSCKILHFFWFTIQVILQQCPLQLHRVYSNSCSQQRSLIVFHNIGDLLDTKFVLLVFWWPQSMIHNGGSFDHPSISVGEPFLQVVFKTCKKIWFRTCELYYAACGFLTEGTRLNLHQVWPIFSLLLVQHWKDIGQSSVNISGSSILPLKYLGHHTESRHNIMQQRSKLHYIPLSEKLKKALHLAFGSCKHFQAIYKLLQV